MLQTWRRRLWRTLNALAVVSRIRMAPLSMSIPVTAALAADVSLNFAQGLGLALVGLCAHIFGFTLNDLIDHPLDATVRERRRHPLATGVLRPRTAWLVTAVQVPAALALYGILGGNTPGLAVLILSGLLSLVYNLWSKWGTLPRWLAEASLAASTGLLSLAAAMLGGPLAVESCVFALAGALILLLLNSVASGLKDLKTDAEFGARSFALASGARIIDGDQVVIPRALKAYSFTLVSAVSACLAWLAALYRPAPVIAVLVFTLCLYAALHLRMLLGIESFRELRRSLPLLSGYYHYTALLLVISDRMPGWMLALTLLFALRLLAIPIGLAVRAWRLRYAPV